MRGIVIHHRGGTRRSIQGRATGPRLSVRPVLAPPPADGGMSARPVCFIFEDGGRVIAKSSCVLLTKERRYPGVEHWYVLPEKGHPGEITDTEPLSYPVETSAAAGLK